MFGILKKDLDELIARKQINRLENIAVRNVDITEAWQESGSDFITVRVYANLLDYNVDENTGQVISGAYGFTMTLLNAIRQIQPGLLGTGAFLQSCKK